MKFLLWLLFSYVQWALASHAYSFQTFSALEVLGASKMNQIEVNVRDHVHGEGGVSEAAPVGTVVPFAGASEPTGWLFCYGQAVSRTTYADLFTAISTTYGTGDGSTTFNLPDLRGRAVFGQDDMGGVSANRVANVFDGDVLGQTGGAEQSTLAAGNHAAHGHTEAVYAATGDTAGTPVVFAGKDAANGNQASLSVDNQGSGTAFSNMPPAIILNYIIKT